MGKQFKIKVNEKMVSYLERLTYDYQMREKIIKTLIEEHKNDAEFLVSPLFEKYHKDTAEVYTEFELAKEELVKSYIPEVLNEHQYNWRLDGKNEEIVVDMLCDCEVEI